MCGYEYCHKAYVCWVYSWVGEDPLEEEKAQPTPAFLWGMNREVIWCFSLFVNTWPPFPEYNPNKQILMISAEALQYK